MPSVNPNSTAEQQNASGRAVPQAGAVSGGVALGLPPVLTVSSAITSSNSSRARRDVVPPLFDPVSSLRYLQDGMRNSWFFIGCLETTAGHRRNCLVHQIIGSMPGSRSRSPVFSTLPTTPIAPTGARRRCIRQARSRLTVLHPDGTHVIAEIAPANGAQIRRRVPQLTAARSGAGPRRFSKQGSDHGKRR